MIPDTQTIIALHKRYAGFVKADTELLFERVFTHCQIVAEIALWCADRIDMAVNRDVLCAAALLHDVGTYPFFDADGRTDGYGFYPMHAILGGKLVLDEGFDPRIAAVIETHIMMGLSEAEIHPEDGRDWPLPHRDYRPSSIEGEILCYADRFHSKDPQFNGYQVYLAKMRKMLPLQAPKFEADAKRFGIPDIAALAQKYNQKVR